MKTQIQDYITYDIPIWHYVLFAVCALVTAWVIIHSWYRIITRTGSPKYFFRILCLFLIFSYPAIVYYVDITQMKIYPSRVKYIVLDFSHSYLSESDTVSMVNSTKTTKNAICTNDKKCTIPVVSFKHNRNETFVQFSAESKDVLYCGDCPSPIFFDWSKKEFYAQIIVLPEKRIASSPLYEMLMK